MSASRRRTVGVGAAVTLALVTGCGGQDTPAVSSSSASSSVAGSPSPSPRVSSPPAEATANQVALGWRRAYRGDTWRQFTRVWVTRVEPWVTPALARRYATTATGHETTARKRFVRHKCVATVTDTTAVQPPEAPQRDDARWVQVTGQIRTRCATGGNPDTELAEATVQVTRTGAEWRVSKRLN